MGEVAKIQNSPRPHSPTHCLCSAQGNPPPPQFPENARGWREYLPSIIINIRVEKVLALGIFINKIIGEGRL